MDYEIMMNGNVRIGQLAPEFEAETTIGNIRLSDYKGKWLVLFSHPRRFYPRVCFNIGIKLEEFGACGIVTALEI